MEDLERKLQYSFRNRELLNEALNHSSYANEHRGGLGSNERLEFLGDSVLGFVAAEFLFKRYGSLPEGDLTRMRAALVCEQSLYEVARELDGGMDQARDLINRVLLSQAPAAEERRDYKTTLQEVVQRRSGQVLTYHMVDQSGPDHNKTFLFEVCLNGETIGRGEGHSKKEAEQAAARDALETLPAS